jgi:hypothetical protein
MEVSRDRGRESGGGDRVERTYPGDDGARREGATTQEHRRRKERAGWNT